MNLIHFTPKDKEEMRHILSLERDGLLEILGVHNENTLLIQVKADRLEGLKKICKSKPIQLN